MPESISGLVRVCDINTREHILNIVFIDHIKIGGENDIIHLISGVILTVNKSQTNKILAAFGETDETIG